MEPRQSPNKGHKSDKLIRNALMLALQEAAVDADGNPSKKLRIIATKVVEKAMEGDVPAFKEIADRVDGRAHQSIDVEGGMNLTVEVVNFGPEDSVAKSVATSVVSDAALAASAERG